MDIKKFVKIGRPGYRVTKQRDADNGQQSLLFEVILDMSQYLQFWLIQSLNAKCHLQVDYPEIAEGIFPRHRFMSAYEQKVYPSLC